MQGRERTLDEKCSSPEVRDSSSEQHFCLEKSIRPICEKNLFGKKEEGMIDHFKCKDSAAQIFRRFQPAGVRQ